MKTRSVVLAVVILLFAALAGAQDTTFGTSLFSATFNGPVSSQEVGTKGGTSTTVAYLSGTEIVSQIVGVRTINAPGIAVDRTSLDVYAADALKGGKTQDDRRYFDVQGHIAVYVNAHYTDTGAPRRRRWLAILLNSRTVILILQDAQADFNDGGVSNWKTLTDSLTINERTCFLPEGCN